MSLNVCIDTEMSDREDWALKECMEELLEDGASPNAEQINGEKLIFYVIKNGKKRSLEMLLKYGLDIKARGLDRYTSPFAEAMKQNNLEMLETLYNALGSGDNTPESRAEYL